MSKTINLKTRDLMMPVTYDARDGWLRERDGFAFHRVRDTHFGQFLADAINFYAENCEIIENIGGLLEREGK